MAMLAMIIEQIAFYKEIQIFWVWFQGFIGGFYG
jgi:hypothetical protein